MADLDDPRAEIQPFDRPGVAALADRQHGVAAHRQLIRLSLGPGAIKHRADTGGLHRLYRGVYAVGRKTVSRKGHWLAAVLACGPHAVLSHLSAAALWGVLWDRRAAIDVTVPGRTRRGSGNIILHNVRRLHPDDRRRRDYIPVTSLARTLLDLAEVVPLRQLTRAIDEAERRGVFDLRAVDELCARSRGRRGVRALREAIRGYRPMPPLLRSGLERRFVELCDQAGLPRPAMNLSVVGYEVDASWLDHKLIIEVDSYELHRTRAACETDRARDAALQREGLRVLRVTDRRLLNDPTGIARDLRAILKAD